jgi:hypothetical protein
MLPSTLSNRVGAQGFGVLSGKAKDQRDQLLQQGFV